MISGVKLKSGLEFNSNLGAIIDTLKIAASIQLRQFQAQLPLSEEFFDHLKECAALLEGQRNQHPLWCLRRDLPRCVIGITSDEGFLGDLNTLIVNAVLDSCRDKGRDKIVILGQRGAGYLEDVGIKPISLCGITDTNKPQESEDLKEYILKGHANEEFGDVIIVYPKFISIGQRHIERLTLLPCSFGTDLEESANIRLDRQFSLIEPDSMQILSAIARLWLGYKLRYIFWSSKLSEFSARLMHLDSSEQELKDMNQKLKVDYLRYLHIRADKAIREISASHFMKE